jgi:hypothetical protein
MTKPHRATPEQWESIEGYADDYVYDACFLELRDRIEALEAAQHAHVDTSHLTDAEREQIRQKAANATFAELLMPPPRIKAPISPADSLIDRVAKALYDAPNNHEGWRSEARAAILEVAAWLREQHGGDLIAATVLRREANR